LKKLERAIDWGTDSAAAKKGDYFQVKDVSLYDRLGGDEAVEVVATMLLDKTLREPAVAGVFDLADKPAVQLRLKSLLAMVFGGPYPYSAADLKPAPRPWRWCPASSTGSWRCSRRRCGTSRSILRYSPLISLGVLFVQR
jgi:Bacterial-like globin